MWKGGTKLPNNQGVLLDIELLYGFCLAFVQAV